MQLREILFKCFTKKKRHFDSFVFRHQILTPQTMVTLLHTQHSNESHFVFSMYNAAGREGRPFTPVGVLGSALLSDSYISNSIWRAARLSLHYMKSQKIYV